MNLTSILTIISQINKALIKTHPKLMGEKLTLAKTVKVGEEIGELNREILGSLDLQRNRKNSHKLGDKVGEEWADCFITLFCLADHLNIDIEKQLEEKFEAIKNRYGIETKER